MRNKGFTLIELLAVIVILAILATIAIVVVTKITTDSGNSALLISADNYLKAVNQTIIQKKMEYGATYNPEKCSIKSNGNLLCDDKTEEFVIEINGQRPTDGIINFENGKIDKAILTINDKVIKQDETGELVFSPKIICTLAYNSQEPDLDIGAKYECKVDPNKDPYTFYVLSKNYVKNEDGTDSDVVESVNLIMDQNINSDGSYPANNVTSANAIDNVYSLVVWTYDLNKAINGPRQAMIFLYNATQSWTNVPGINFSYTSGLNVFTESIDGLVTITARDLTTFTVGSKGNPVRARMPYSAEIREKGLQAFPYYNLESGYYWTLSNPSNSYGGVYVVSYEGEIVSQKNIETNGVRPVITIQKDAMLY